MRYGWGGGSFSILLKLLHEGERGKSESQPKSKRQDVGWNRGGGSDFCERKRRFSFCAGKQRRQDRGTRSGRRGHYCFPAAAEKHYLCGGKDGAEIDRGIFRRHDFCDSEGEWNPQPERQALHKKRNPQPAGQALHKKWKPQPAGQALHKKRNPQPAGQALHKKRKPQRVR